MEQEMDRLKVLSEAMSAFADATAEPALLLETIGRQTAAALGATCCFARLSTDGVPQFMFDPETAVTPHVQQLAAEASRLALDSQYPLAKALRSATCTRLPGIAAEVLRARFPRVEDQDSAIALDIKSILLVPVRARGELVGALSLVRHGSNAVAFSDADMAFAQNIADHAALALANAALLSSARQELAQRQKLEERLQLLTNLAQEFSSATPEYTALLDLYTRRVGELIGDICAIRFLDEDGEWFGEPGSVYHPDPAVAARLRTLVLSDRVHVNHTPMGAAIATGKPVMMPVVDTQELAARFPPHARDFIESLGVCSAVIVPLKSRGAVIGVTSVSRTSRSRPFTEDDLRLIEEVARHAALLVTNARQFARLRAELVERERVTKQLRLVSELSQEFARAAGDVDALLALVARRIGQVLGDGCSVLMLTARGTLEPNLDYLFNTDPARLEYLKRAIAADPPRVDGGVSGPAVATGQTVFMPRVDLDQIEASYGQRQRELITQTGTHSIVAVPLRTGDTIIGVCTVYRTTTLDAFDDNERRLIEDLVAHASLTITNAQLLAASRASLKTQEVLRRGFLEAAPDAVLIVDTRGAIILVNTQTERLFGYERRELVGQPIEILVPTRYRAHHPQNRRSYLGAPDARPMGAGFALFALRKDGTEFAAEISLSPIVTPDGTLVAAAIRDVTERQREMEQRNRRMEEANRLKSEFLANMSHELRTPLNSVIGFAALMHAGKAGPLADVHHEYIADILASSRHLLQLINDVLDLSKVEAGRTELHLEWAESATLVNEVRDIIRGLASEKQIRVALELSPDVARVKLDTRLFKQVLYNYLSNAIKFTMEGGRVTLRIRPEGDARFRLEVEDTGIGIRPEDMSRLFVEFQQLDQGPSKRYPGTGLGLALTKRIVHALGGSVEATSVLHEGSTFSAVLPRECRDAG